MSQEYIQEGKTKPNGVSVQEKASHANMIAVQQKSYVSPARPSSQKYCNLTTFDLPYVTFHYNQKIILYPSPSQGFASVVDSMKKSLSEALVHFYPLAGRLCLDEDGILKVDCNDAGVYFIEASSDVVGLGDLKDCDGSSNVMQDLVPYVDTLNAAGFFLPMVGVQEFVKSGNLPPYHRGIYEEWKFASLPPQRVILEDRFLFAHKDVPACRDLEIIPVEAEQVTKLRDGVAIGIAINHLIVDGYSTWHFMRSWAELSRGSSVVCLPPLHDRAMARNTKVKLNINPPTRNSHANGTKTDKPLLRGKIFHISKEMMEKIKTRANKNREGKPFSSFQSLGAHLWQAVTRARKLTPEEITVFTLFIDCRTRVAPPLPKNYFGNVIQGIYGATAVGLLLSNDLSFAANMLQQVIDSHGAKAIEQKNEEWEQKPKLYGFSDAGMNCVTVGSSPRFEVYENDFGWGRPVRVRSGCNNKFDGMVYLYPGQDGGGSVDVEISLLPRTMDMLESDSEFLLTN